MDQPTEEYEEEPGIFYTSPEQTDQVDELSPNNISKIAGFLVKFTGKGKNYDLFPLLCTIYTNEAIVTSAVSLFLFAFRDNDTIPISVTNFDYSLLLPFQNKASKTDTFTTILKLYDCFDTSFYSPELADIVGTQRTTNLKKTLSSRYDLFVSTEIVDLHTIITKIKANTTDPEYDITDPYILNYLLLIPNCGNDVRNSCLLKPPVKIDTDEYKKYITNFASLIDLIKTNAAVISHQSIYALAVHQFIITYIIQGIDVDGVDSEYFKNVSSLLIPDIESTIFKNESCNKRSNLYFALQDFFFKQAGGDNDNPNASSDFLSSTFEYELGTINDIRNILFQHDFLYENTSYTSFCPLSFASIISEENSLEAPAPNPTEQNANDSVVTTANPTYAAAVANTTTKLNEAPVDTIIIELLTSYRQFVTTTQDDFKSKYADLFKTIELTITNKAEIENFKTFKKKITDDLDTLNGQMTTLLIHLGSAGLPTTATKEINQICKSIFGGSFKLCDENVKNVLDKELNEAKDKIAYDKLFSINDPILTVIEDITNKITTDLNMSTISDVAKLQSITDLNTQLNEELTKIQPKNFKAEKKLLKHNEFIEKINKSYSTGLIKYNQTVKEIGVLKDKLQANTTSATIASLDSSTQQSNIDAELAKANDLFSSHFSFLTNYPISDEKFENGTIVVDNLADDITQLLEINHTYVTTVSKIYNTIVKVGFANTPTDFNIVFESKYLIPTQTQTDLIVKTFRKFEGLYKECTLQLQKIRTNLNDEILKFTDKIDDIKTKLSPLQLTESKSEIRQLYLTLLAIDDEIEECRINIKDEKYDEDISIIPMQSKTDLTAQQTTTTEEIVELRVKIRELKLLIENANAENTDDTILEAERVLITINEAITDLTTRFSYGTASADDSDAKTKYKELQEELTMVKSTIDMKKEPGPTLIKSLEEYNKLITNGFKKETGIFASLKNVIKGDTTTWTIKKIIGKFTDDYLQCITAITNIQFVSSQAPSPSMFTKLLQTVFKSKENPIVTQNIFLFFKVLNHSIKKLTNIQSEFMDIITERISIAPLLADDDSAITDFNLKLTNAITECTHLNSSSETIEFNAISTLYTDINPLIATLHKIDHPNASLFSGLTETGLKLLPFTIITNSFKLKTRLTAFDQANITTGYDPILSQLSSTTTFTNFTNYHNYIEESKQAVTDEIEDFLTKITQVCEMIEKHDIHSLATNVVSKLNTQCNALNTLVPTPPTIPILPLDNKPANSTSGETINKYFSDIDSIISHELTVKFVALLNKLYNQFPSYFGNYLLFFGSSSAKQQADEIAKFIFDIADMFNNTCLIIDIIMVNDKVLDIIISIINSTHKDINSLVTATNETNITTDMTKTIAILKDPHLIPTYVGNTFFTNINTPDIITNVHNIITALETIKQYVTNTLKSNITNQTMTYPVLFFYKSFLSQYSITSKSNFTYLYLKAIQQSPYLATTKIAIPPQTLIQTCKLFFTITNIYTAKQVLQNYTAYPSMNQFHDLSKHINFLFYTPPMYIDFITKFIDKTHHPLYINRTNSLLQILYLISIWEYAIYTSETNHDILAIIILHLLYNILINLKNIETKMGTNAVNADQLTTPLTHITNLLITSIFNIYINGNAQPLQIPTNIDQDLLQSMNAFISSISTKTTLTDLWMSAHNRASNNVLPRTTSTGFPIIFIITLFKNTAQFPSYFNFFNLPSYPLSTPSFYYPKTEFTNKNQFRLMTAYLLLNPGLFPSSPPKKSDSMQMTIPLIQNLDSSVTFELNQSHLAYTLLKSNILKFIHDNYSQMYTNYVALIKSNHIFEFKVGINVNNNGGSNGGGSNGGGSNGGNKLAHTINAQVKFISATSNSNDAIKNLTTFTVTTATTKGTPYEIHLDKIQKEFFANIIAVKIPKQITIDANSTLTALKTAVEFKTSKDAQAAYKKLLDDGAKTGKTIRDQVSTKPFDPQPLFTAAAVKEIVDAQKAKHPRLTVLTS